MKVAIIHDWAVAFGGGEKVIKSLYKIYPNADFYFLVSSKKKKKKIGIPHKQVFNSYLQKFPFAEKKYRSFLPFFIDAIEKFDLSNYDLIISSSFAVAKGVLSHPQQTHISYCHSPVRYAWDLTHQYLRDAKKDSGIKGFIIRYFLRRLRIWDVISSNRVDHFIANSKFVLKRIEKTYRRKGDVIYPPVDTESFTLAPNSSQDYYVTASRLVPYKKVDLIVAAFKRIKDKKLIVIGEGPELKKIKKLASSSPNITVLGHVSFNKLVTSIQNAKAFIFAAEEDFGIAPLEAQSCGVPVIAFGKGGALETVIDKKTGTYFHEQKEESIVEAVLKFEKIEFDKNIIRKHAKGFTEDVFVKRIKEFVDEKLVSL